MPAGPCVGGHDSPYERSPADVFMRKLLRLPTDAAPTSVFGAEDAFGKSIAISAIRCTFTYILLPLLAPVLNPIIRVSDGPAAPIIGIVLGLVSMVAITFSMRRFFGSDHKWRWGYAIIGGTIFVMLIVMMGMDLRSLVRSI